MVQIKFKRALKKGRAAEQRKAEQRTHEEDSFNPYEKNRKGAGMV